MKRFIILFVVCFMHLINSFNIDTRSPIVYNDPHTFVRIKSDRHSYFGLSVILFSDGKLKPWIQIGSPKAVNKADRYKATGVIFRCGIKGTCYEVRLDSVVRGVTDFAFFGNSMDISDDKTKYVVCGHRWTQYVRQDYWAQGACHWSYVNSNDTKMLTPLTGFQFAGYQVISISPTQRAYNYAQGQVGFSAHFLNDKNESQLLLGAPGLYNWHGTPIVCKSSFDDDPISSRLSQRIKRQTSNELSNVNIPAGEKIREIEMFDLLGYSVTSGYYFDKENVYYAAAAPKSQMLGKVLIFTFALSSGNGLNVKHTIQGTQIGEYFGASMTSVDINNDGLEDLIVGAPFHRRTDYNEGRIYIFLGNKQGTFTTPEKASITGKEMGGSFGLTLMSLRDIDYDGYGDIAVAAPYEDAGSGAVYIYRGSAKGLITEPAQKIIGKSLVPNIRAFGISISKPADIDGNEMNDIAIGAYMSGQAVLLRSQVAVTLNQVIKTTTDKLSFEARQFTFSSCISYNGKSVQAPIFVKRSIVIDERFHRAYLSQGLLAEQNITLTRQNMEFCTDITIDTKEDITNRYEPLSIKVSLELITNVSGSGVISVGKEVTGEDNFCVFCPILNPFASKLELQKDIAFSLGCGEDNICNAELTLSSEFSNLPNNGVYTIGSKKYLTLKTTVKNNGEHAYLTDLSIKLPNSVHLRSKPIICTEEDLSSIICSVDNPLVQNRDKTIELELDMEEVNSGKYDKTLEFNLTVSTSSENTQPSLQQLHLMLVTDADVDISGRSKEQSYSYANVSNSVVEFAKIYQIQKFGVSPIGQVSFQIFIPTSVITDTGNVAFLTVYPPEGTLGGQPLTCQSNISYATQKNELSSGSLLIEDPGNEKDDGKELEEVRRRREATAKFAKYETKVADVNDYPVNRTLFLNCTRDIVGCETIDCIAGPFINENSAAELKLKMEVDISKIAAMLAEKDILIVATKGIVSMEHSELSDGTRMAHEVFVSSVILGPNVEQTIALWIIIVSILGGLLLLLLIIGGLVKAGFFRRQKKIELENAKLKEESEFSEDK